ncbi:MAG: hypothetical protein JJU05_09105 [Verrucomicrobia bacterium]|nr:hypothetical protein [Verrucomicrobiota bacterium]MCH8527632.1 hypothetical protein [Kiritimatiellia bacterium]
MVRSIASFCLLVLFLLAVFGREGALVTMWGRMIVERSAERSFSEAVESTFSGQEPCGQCMQITRDWSEAFDETLVTRVADVSANWCLFFDEAVPRPGEQAAGGFAECSFLYGSPVTGPLTPPPRHFQMA